jgi:hypothetical protein
VRERLIRELIGLSFQGEGQPLRRYIEQIFQAADFLRYDATEQQLVDRVVMNFHPQVLRQAQLLDRSRTRKDSVAATIEEKGSIAREGERGRIVGR